MPRPRAKRYIRQTPARDMFKPAGLPSSRLEWVTLPLEGLEAMRLVDVEGFSQAQAAQLMGVSTPTLCRVLAGARGQVAQALVSGLGIRIQGGDYHLIDEEITMLAGRGPGRGRQRRRGGRGGGNR